MMTRSEYKSLNQHKLDDHQASGDPNWYIVYAGDYNPSVQVSSSCADDYEKALKEYERLSSLYDWTTLTVATRIGTAASLKDKGLRFDGE